MFNNKRILITGGTGSFGQQFVSDTLKKFKPKEIIVYSRDEMKQWFMLEKFKKYKNLKFTIGDIRDRDRLSECSKGVDILIHAAATKIIPTAEINPEECIKTNINGAQNVIYSAKLNKIKKIVALSTDKASNPINLYGATKLASDKLFISANFSTNNQSKFSIVRYGNVIGSRGSIIPFFLKIKEKNIFPITDINMTRFFITLSEAVKLVWLSCEKMVGGEIFVKKIPSLKIIDIAKAINSRAKFKIIGIRPGEKIHEQMISVDDSYHTYEYKNYFKIIPQISNNKLKYIKGGKKVKKNFTYSSELNDEWMSIKKIKKIINKYQK
jgi:UDP-N-acetylglucosamine 4,6-dehydratase/5-epimerase